MEQLVHGVTLQVRTFLLADLALDWIIRVFLLRLFVALATVELKLILGGHDDVLADGTEVLGRLQQSVNLHHVSVVAAELVEEFITSFDLALHFLHLTLVRLEGFLASEFLKR